MSLGIYFLICILPATLQVQLKVENVKENPCHIQLSCGSCLQLRECAWCSAVTFERGNPRCDQLHQLEANGCSPDLIVDHKSVVELIEDMPLDSVVQLKPQKMDVTLRPNQPVRFNITFKQAENYPVDLYYLMDLTFSMKEHKQKVSELGHALAASMKNITTNFRLGFGSFIDKVVMPYADMVPSRIENPCRDYPCISPYGFRNHLPLTTDFNRFKDEVANANLSGNLDNAEGGFDAIMQAVVCKNHISWKTQSRKIILFATDSIFHQAGDGKLGGIVKPNDGQCHMDASGYYTQSIYQDYPALSQLNTKVVENKVNLVFAVPEEKIPLYDDLCNLLEGAHTAQLSKDSSNIVHVIQEQYNKIRSEIRMNDNSPSPVSIKYFTSCLNKTLKEVNSCDGLQIGDTVTFQVEMELNDCPKDSSDMKQITIYPVGLGEVVTLNLKFLCECDCLKNGEANSSICSGKGTLACGECSCNTNHFGLRCECAGDDLLQAERMAQCKINANSTKVCSGRGDCVCGTCDCYTPEHGGNISGLHCECDSSSCGKDSRGEVCGGPKRGHCCQDVCLCSKGWGGETCECSEDVSKCVAPEDDQTGRHCSGRGKCVCGHCKCNKDPNGYYGGSYCEDCSTCEGRCVEFQPCVECLNFQSGPLADKEACDRNCSTLSQTITTVEVNFVPSAKEKRCIFRDSNDCSFEFFYSYDTDNRHYISVKKDKECSKEAEIWYIVGGTVGSVFLLGLVLLLIVRLIIYLKDKRDYNRFQEEIKKVKWETRETNPIYKEATSKFQNPMYNKEGI